MNDQGTKSVQMQLLIIGLIAHDHLGEEVLHCWVGKEVA
jgi:hypothetical protein